MRFQRSFTVAGATLALLLLHPARLLSQTEMVRGSGSTRPLPASAAPSKHWRMVTLDKPSLLALAERQNSPGSNRVRFTLFPELSVNVDFGTIYSTNGGLTKVYSGKIAGEPDSTAILAFTGNQVVGHFVTHAGQRIELLSTDSGEEVVSEVSEDTAALRCAAKPLETSPAKNTAKAAEPLAAAEDNGQTIDVLVMYTPAAAYYAGGENIIQSRIAAANEEANQSFINSDVDLRFNVVRAQMIPYQEGPDLDYDLQYISGEPQIAALRNQTRADIVHLVSGTFDGSLCGIGWILDSNRLAYDPASAGFSVSSLYCLRPGNPTYHHEIGHNMGLHHDPATRAQQGSQESLLFPWSEGYQQTDRNPTFYDIMAYPCTGCRGVNNWGNPFVSYQGVPTGVDRLFDSAAHITMMKKVVANYRVAGNDPALPAISHLLQPAAGTRLQAGPITFTWEPTSTGFYQLLIGVTGAGSSDVYVSPRLGRPQLSLNLPAINSRTYVRLQTWVSDHWETSDSVFDFGNQDPGTLTATDVTDCRQPVSVITWSFPGAGEVQIRVNAANGPALTGWGAERGSSATGPWVAPGMTFFAVNHGGTVLGKVTPRFACSSPVPAELTATPVTNCASPISTLAWKAAGAGQVQVRIGSASGTPMTGWSPEQGSADTGPWVANGMVFVLVNLQGQEIARVTAVSICGLSPSSFWYENIPSDAAARIRQLSQQGKRIRRLVLTPQGGWLLLSERNDFDYHGIPGDLATWLQKYRDGGSEIKDVAVSPSGGYVILADRNGFRYYNAPQNLIDKLWEFYGDDYALNNVEFTQSNGWALFFGDTGYWASNVPQAAFDSMQQISSQNYPLNQVAFGPNGAWIIIYGGNGFSYAGVAQSLVNRLRDLNQNGKPISHVALGPSGNWVAISNQ